MSDLLIDVPALHVRGPSPVVSERYRFYSTRELIDPLLDEGWEVTQAFQVRSKKYNPYGKHLVRLSHEKLQLGEQRLEAVIRNSHDASSKLEFMLGAWRCICSNGLFIGSSYATVAIPHLRAFEAVQKRAAELITHAPEVAATFDAWKARSLSQDESHWLAVSASVIRWGLKEKPPIDPDSLLEVRRHEDHGNDLWSTFNRVQENVMTGGITRQDGRGRIRRIGAIDATVSINQRLWRAAESLYVGEVALGA
jgi:uncharacterized protein DUF932